MHLLVCNQFWVVTRALLCSAMVCYGPVVLSGYYGMAMQLLGCLDLLIGNCNAGSKMF